MVPPGAGGGLIDFINRYPDEVREIAARVDRAAVERLVELFLEARRRQGRIFFLGVGGRAGNASHAVNDFRKLCDFEAYAPTDNVSELTAPVNDDGASRPQVVDVRMPA